jgi:hypothetical protein
VAPMADIRFINKNGTSVDITTVRKRFFESIDNAGVTPVSVNAVWHDAMRGDRYAREIVEELCGIEIVDSNTGFGFLQ